MKKKILGITTAALLFGGSIGFAATSSPLIGAKVQGMFAIQKADGTKIGDAVVINGTAYVPVRILSDATGTELKLEGKKITLGNTVESSPVIGETTQAKPVSTAKPGTVVDTAKLREQVTSIEMRIQVLKEAAQQAETTALDLKTDEERSARKSYIAELNKRIEFSEAELKQLKTALGE